MQNYQHGFKHGEVENRSVIFLLFVVVLASFTFKVTSKKIVVHIAITVDLAPTWSSWDLSFSLDSSFTVFNPFVSSPEAIIEHAMLAEALKFLQMFRLLIAVSEVSVLWSNRLFVDIVTDVELMAVGVKLSCYFTAFLIDLIVFCLIIAFLVPYSFGFLSSSSVCDSYLPSLNLPPCFPRSDQAFWGALCIVFIRITGDGGFCACESSKCSECCSFHSSFSFIVKVRWLIWFLYQG